MKKTIIIISIIILAYLGFFYLSATQKPEDNIKNEIVKIEGNNKKLDALEINSVSKIDKMPYEDGLIEFLSLQKDFSWKTEMGTKNFCVYENLESKEKLFPIAIWVRCGEFKIKDGELKELSGMSGPAKIDYPNALSFFDPEKFSYKVPGDGSLYAKDIKKLFSEEVQEKIYNINREDLNKKLENLARISIK